MKWESRALYSRRGVKRFLLGLQVLSLLVGLSWPGWGTAGTAGDGGWTKVVRVDDGDSVQLEDGRRVRYVGIDAPERGGPGQGEYLAEEATRFNRRLVLGQEVRLELDQEGTDRFHRLLAHLYLKTGLWVNEQLVLEGFAHVLYQRPNTGKFDRLLSAQRKALEARRGIWARALQETETGYRASGKTRKMHRPDCALGLKIGTANLVLFQNKIEAYDQGYSPCRICRP